VAAASGVIVIFVTVLSVPLSAAESLGLSDAETVGWIMAGYGVPGLLTLVFVARYRQPLLLTGNIFLLIFVASLGAEIPWPELVGAAVVAGLIVLVIGPLGVTAWLARWLPAPIVFGVLAGAVLPFFVDLFTAAGDEPLIVGGTLVAYVLAARFVEPRVPALLPALATGLVLAVATGETGTVGSDTALLPSFVTPELSISGIATVTPVMVVLVTLQANVPSVVFLRKEAYDPPEQVLSAASGVGSSASSLLGPVGVSLSLPATALCAGPDAGDHRVRHVAAWVAGAASLLIGLAAGFATAIAGALPEPLLVGFVGLAVLGVLATALRNITAGPLILGPLFAFGIAQSDLELIDLGPFFWALVGGLVVSAVLERDAWRRLQDA
jgi:benzoate membrane transport protein